MSRKRTKKNPKDELNAMRKVLCDEAQNQMKVRNFGKALIGYNQVGESIKVHEDNYATVSGGSFT